MKWMEHLENLENVSLSRVYYAILLRSVSNNYIVVIGYVLCVYLIYSLKWHLRDNNAVGLPLNLSRWECRASTECR
jgi:hypothetical protein